MDWTNRIIESGEEDPEQLMANPFNWRIHPRAQQEALVALVEEVGWVATVIVNKTTGHLLDGHLRVDQALKAKQKKVPVSYVDLTEEEEMVALAMLDTTTSLAQLDPTKAQALLSQVQTKQAHLETMLEDMKHRISAPVDADVVKDETARTLPPVVDIAFRIGPYVFRVDLKEYHQWLRELYDLCDNDADLVLEEIQRRLGLDTV